VGEWTSGRVDADGFSGGLQPVRRAVRVRSPDAFGASPLVTPRTPSSRPRPSSHLQTAGLLWCPHQPVSNVDRKLRTVRRYRLARSCALAPVCAGT
jgi:hypothetical protein